MTGSNRCCCLHVKTCATIVSIIGIIFAVLSIISVLFLWFYIPLAIFTILIYIYILIGIRLERSEYLLPATVFLAINIIFNVFMFIGFIIVGSIAPLDLVSGYAEELNGNIEKAQTGKNAVRIAYFVCALIVLIVTSYTIFAFTVILKARDYLISTVPPLPYLNSTMEHPLYLTSSTPQIPKYNHSVF